MFVIALGKYLVWSKKKTRSSNSFGQYNRNVLKNVDSFTQTHYYAKGTDLMLLKPLKPTTFNPQIRKTPKTNHT